MTIAPKIKIVGGLAMSAGGAYGLYKSFNPESKDRIANGVVGGLLLISGILMLRKGWVQNSSLKDMPQKVSGNSGNEEVKKVIADAVRQGKVSANASGITAPTQPSTTQSSKPAQSQVNPQAGSSEQKKWQNGKVVGQIDIKRIEESKAKKEGILKRIDQLKVQHNQLIKKNGWHAGNTVRNEIEILKAQLFWC
jgi:hypothetical protein